MMHLTRVDLPAPFSPRSACTLPALTRTEALSSATRSPKRLPMPTVSTAMRARRPLGRLVATIASIRCAHAIPLISAAERADRAEHAALHLHHLDGVVVVALVGGAAAVLQQQAFEAAVVGLAHGGVHADVGGDAGEHDVLDAARAQDQFEVGGAERALARLVDDRLAGLRRELRDDVPARLAAHQDAPARARDRRCRRRCGASASACSPAGRRGRADGLRGCG